jgi:tetratricopeptide (TPR) repeat protein
MLAERLIRQRVWFGLEQEIAAAKVRIESEENIYAACEPAFNWLVDEIPRLACEPDIPRVVKVARLVLGLVRDCAYPQVRAQVGRLERFTAALREADRSWGTSRAPSQRKVSAWLAEQAALVGMSSEQAYESVYETPHRWPVVAAALDSAALRQVRWKVDVAHAEAEFKSRNYGKARDGFAAILARETACAPAHEGLSRVLLVMGQKARAIVHCRAAVQTGDASASAWNNLAWYLATDRTPTEGQLSEALWAARRAVALAPLSQYWDTLAEVLARMGDLPGAIIATRNAIRDDPDRPSYRDRMRALCLNLLPTAPLTGAAPASSSQMRTSEKATAALSGINLSKPSDSGISLQSGPGLGIGQADSIELAPLSDEEMKTTASRAQKAAAPSKPKKSLSATPLPPVKKGEKDIFDDSDFEVDVSLGDSDSDDKTLQLEADSDFDLEDSDTGSEVFAIDEEAVDQNASTAMASSDFADEDEDEDDGFESASWNEADWESNKAATHRCVSSDSRGATGQAELPRPLSDRVQFSLTAPAKLEQGCAYAVDVWAYLDNQRAEVMALAQQSQGTEELRVKTKSGVVLTRGAMLLVRLAIRTLEVADPEDVISWDGEIGNATFPVSVPPGARIGPHAGTATFHVDQLTIAKLHFVLEVGQGPSEVAPLVVSESRPKRAFASYASEDREEVLGRLHGILKVLPDLDLFLDVASLRSGERWEERLFQEIGRRDILYLFWSDAASRSPWVDREWRTALALRGIAGIDPVPLVSPEEVPPPAELASQLHFNDWLLAFMRGRRRSPA